MSATCRRAPSNEHAVRAGTAEMKIEWRRGFFRAWMVLALTWVALVGWSERDQFPESLSYVRHDNECWDRLAKWPDGKRFEAENGIWELMPEFDNQRNVQPNKRNNAWRADSIPERKRWRGIIAQKLEDCEAAKVAAKPILQRWTLTVSTLEEPLSLIFLPPLALLVSGWLLGWIVRGFRASLQRQI
jgi:hypothetical protein